VRCPVASCMKDVQPIGLPTGLQELLAMRIHLARDHGLYKTMNQVMALRVDEESVDLMERETLLINVDQNEKWLDPP